jgi:FkbM family methyltransferase
MRAMPDYYSQQGEDALLDYFFAFKPSGYFVDVGAFDGTHLSNSYIFEQRGWSGLCIEPTPPYYELCVKNRPGSRCVRAACVSSEKGDVTFQFERGGLFSGISADAGFVRDTFQRAHVPFRGFESMQVPAATLNSLIGNGVSEVDFISIDVEGTEAEVLTGLDLDRYKPRVLVLEANTAAEKQALDEYLVPRGYRLARSMNWNHFYVSSEADRALLRSIEFSARLARVPHPLDPLHSRFGYPANPLVNWPAER